MENIISLEERRIVVTGASSGIGKDTAILLSRMGAKIVLVARRKEKLCEVMDSLSGEGHAFYCADLRQIDEIEDLVKTIVAQQGKLDGLVYAAGVTIPIPLMQFKPEKVRDMFDINFFGFYEIVRQICKKGRFNEGMRIVGISSTAATIGNKTQSVYSASKAAMDGAVRSIAREVADKKICINTVAPGMTATDMYANYLNKNGEDSKTNQELLRRQYLGIANTTDIANAIAYLISPAARFITGTSLLVDGGAASS